MHQIDGMVDLLDRHHMSNQIIDVDLLIHVPVDDTRHFGSAANAAECRTAPVASRDELERTGVDLLTRAGHADDHGGTPTTMAALERLAHQLDITDTLEAVVGAAAGQLDQVRNEVAR